MTEAWNAFPPRTPDLRPERSKRASDRAPFDFVLDDTGTYRVHNPWRNFVSGTPMPEWAPKPKPVWRANVLPLSENAEGRLQLDWHAGLLGSVWSAVTLPGDAAAGRVDPRSEEGISRTIGLAGFLGGGTNFSLRSFRTSSLGMRERGGVSKVPPDESGLLNLLTAPSRSIELDYPGVLPINASGYLTHTRFGQPLNTSNVAGRIHADAPDVALQLAAARNAIEAGTGKPVSFLSATEMGGYLGRTKFDLETKRPLEVDILESLSPQARQKVINHELGHVLHQLLGEQPIPPNLRGGFERIYHLQNTDLPLPRRGGVLGEMSSSILEPVFNQIPGNRLPWSQRFAEWAFGRPYGPQDVGYPKNRAFKELMVEGYRAYFETPNALKALEPGVADFLARTTNAHPEIGKFIQLNSGSPFGIFGLLSSARALAESESSLPRRGDGGRILRAFPLTDPNDPRFLFSAFASADRPQPDAMDDDEKASIVPGDVSQDQKYMTVPVSPSYDDLDAVIRRRLQEQPSYSKSWNGSTSGSVQIP